ncbi:hypothetical protein Ddye_022817 [Dipteronia dyeriana]|uniref:F-box domain-containing protein n=1 Tax=Dipteronia dyeriana TaxID=168575 RepID=A0AAD9WRJ0_9ROSI|nr:hypothetical protein Ddye_022817 [Dipteronia dyeriana]
MNLSHALALAEESDHFDRLPDEVILLIFHSIGDAVSLLRCLCVCKRFSCLVPRVRSLHLSLPRRKPISRPSSLFNCFTLFFSKFISKPLKHLCRIKPSSFTSSHSNSINRVLGNFREINSIHIKLPFYGGTDQCGGVAADGFDYLVKWKAEFGRALKSCVIMGANSLQRIGEERETEQVQEEEQVELELLTDRELRLRVVWIISSLISASARHHFLKQVLSDHPMLRSVVVSDGNNQGKLCMGKEQLVEMRDSMEESLMVVGSNPNTSTWLERTPVPELSIKMSHVRVLELPETGYKMRGATLVEVRAVSGEMKGNEGDSGFDGEGEEKAFGEAVREMLKVKKSYVMTMNAF